MYDDFTPIIHILDGRSIKVWAISDVHIGAKEADIAGFKAFLEKVEADEDSYLVLCGDLINNGIRSANCPTDIYEETMPPQAQIDFAAELLEPVKDRILGAVSGNHENRTKKAVDLDPTLAIMTLLRKQDLYRRHMAFIRITLKSGGVRDIYSMLLVHGKSANKKRQFDYAVEGVDAVIAGHLHDGNIQKPSRIVFTRANTVVIKSVVSLTGCSWLSYGGYASSNLYLPKTTSDPQALLLEYTGSNNKKGNIRVIW